jgi:CheY-like chemotaxis protein/ketosteroid isomerase-like protein
MAHETILVVDDSCEFVQALKEYILGPLGYNVIHAPDGQSGLDMGITHNPDLIMLDMNLPHMTGLEMLTALRQNDCQIPVIFMTMQGSENIAVEAFRLGVCDYLIKPFTTEEVQRAMNRALRSSPVCEKARLDCTLIAVETVRQTAITLSHYINNHLMTLSGGLNLLQENLQQELPNHPMLSRIVQDGQASVQQIETVVRVLQRITKVQYTTYHDKTCMIDVEAALREELGQ